MLQPEPNCQDGKRRGQMFMGRTEVIIWVAEPTPPQILVWLLFMQTCLNSRQVTTIKHSLSFSLSPLSPLSLNICHTHTQTLSFLPDNNITKRNRRNFQLSLERINPSSLPQPTRTLHMPTSSPAAHRQLLTSPHAASAVLPSTCPPSRELASAQSCLGGSPAWNAPSTPLAWLAVLDVPQLQSHLLRGTFPSKTHHRPPPRHPVLFSCEHYPL